MSPLGEIQDIYHLYFLNIFIFFEYCVIFIKRLRSLYRIISYHIFIYVLGYIFLLIEIFMK
jgi:hypothetical protein